MDSPLSPMTTTLCRSRCRSTLFRASMRAPERGRHGLGDAAMPIAGADAVWDALQVCRNGIQLKFGVRVPTHPQGSPEKQLRAIYRRIQAASPPPTRDGRPWEYGIRVKDDTEDGQPLRRSEEHTSELQSPVH